MGAVSISLAEWQTATPETDTGLRGVSLDAAPEARRAAEVLTRSGVLEVEEQRAGLRVRARSHVGRVQLGDVTITVQPKLSGLPLWSLLRYAYGLRDLKAFSPARFATAPEAFHELLVRQLAGEAADLLEHGLHRRYVRRNEELASPRGRLDIQALARRQRVGQAVLPCIHHPRSDDCLVNQVLLAGLQLALRMTGDAALRADLQRLAAVLREGVSPVRLDRSVFARLRREADRLVVAYRPALEITRLLFESEGASLEVDGAHQALPGFLFDMNRFFQALLSRFLGDHLTGYTVRDEHRLQEMLAYVPGWNPRQRRSPVLRPDFVIFDGPRRVATLDAKYRDLWETDLPREMLYQLAVYALGQAPAGEAAILYPTLDPAAREARIKLNDPAGGGARAVVALRPVNLIHLARLVGGPQGEVSARERGAYAALLAGAP